MRQRTEKPPQLVLALGFDELNARAVVEVIPGEEIKSSRLTLKGRVPGLSAEKFQKLADKAKNACPVSKALGAIEVSLQARLIT